VARTINEVIKRDPKLLAEYTRRRISVQAWFEDQGRGSMSQAAYELKIPLSNVSVVLRGVYVNEAILVRLERYVEEMTAIVDDPPVGASSESATGRA
jgi:hypothetical protein